MAIDKDLELDAERVAPPIHVGSIRNPEKLPRKIPAKVHVSRATFAGSGETTFRDPIQGQHSLGNSISRQMTSLAVWLRRRLSASSSRSLSIDITAWSRNQGHLCIGGAACCDGVYIPQVFRLCNEHVDEVVTVSQDEICAGVRPNDCTDARLHALTTARLHDCTDARLHDCTTERLHGCTAARLHDCTTARLHDCTTARLHDCTAARLHDCIHSHPLLPFTPNLFFPFPSTPSRKSDSTCPIPPNPSPLRPISTRPIPSHPIPADPISSHLIPSHPISSHLIPSHPISSHLIPSHPISPHLIPSHPIHPAPITPRLVSLQGMPAYDEELFGPVASVIRVLDEAEAIRVANDSPFGSIT